MLSLNQIEQRYNDILHNNMEGVAVINQHLQVVTIGFTALGEERIGVLITPWFMNLLLLPEDKGQWGEQLQGATTLRQLPSGQYEFIYSWDKQLGGYGICSLFSPMFEFTSQQQAEETALEVMKALFDSEQYAPTDRQREHFKVKQQFDSQLAGNISEGQGSTSEAVIAEAQQDGGKPAQLSRRQFLSGVRQAGCEKHV